MTDAVPRNAVTRLYEAPQGRDWVAQHWDEFVDIHAEDVVVEARNSAGQRYVVSGRDAAVAEARSLSDVGLRHLTMEPLAVRGDHLAAIRWTNWVEETDVGGGAAAVDQFGVVTTNSDGKVCSVTIFEDAASALAELDARASPSTG